MLAYSFCPSYESLSSHFANIGNLLPAGKKSKYISVQRTQKGRAQGEGGRSEQKGLRQGKGHGRWDQNRSCSEERTLEPSGGFWLEIRRGELSLI